MDHIFRCCIILLASIVFGSQSDAAGFSRSTLDTNPQIDIGVWYPSADTPPTQPNSPFRQALSLDANIKGNNLPLVVISHGDGGWMGGHADTALALAEAGFVAVALDHPGNNYEDESAAPSEWMVSRPADIAAVIEYMLGASDFAAALDPNSVGVFGFSAGGYTALVAAGGRPNIARLIDHCGARPQEFVCRIGLVKQIEHSDLPGSEVAWTADPRISAISIAAPGLGFAFDRPGLSGLVSDVQILSGDLDDRVPYDSNVAPLAAQLPRPPVREHFAKAGHFAFLVPCNPRLETANPRIWQMVCVDDPRFDRASFHDRMNKSIVAFFTRAFGE